LFLVIFDAAFLAILLYLALKNPDYAEKRLKRNESEKPQRVVMVPLVSSAILALVVAGLDNRFHWSFVPFLILATLFVIVGFVMLFFVMRQNSYGSRIIEIQEGQKIIDSGMHSVIRHPMYLSFLWHFTFRRYFWVPGLHLFPQRFFQYWFFSGSETKRKCCWMGFRAMTFT